MDLQGRECGAILRKNNAGFIKGEVVCMIDIGYIVRMCMTKLPEGVSKRILNAKLKKNGRIGPLKIFKQENYIYRVVFEMT